MKNLKYSASQIQMATIAKALGHPARIAIIEHLVKVDSCICGDIVEVLPLAQSTVSQHLKELKTAGIIKGNVEGNSICYCIDKVGLNTFLDYIEQMASVITEGNKNC